MTEQLWPFALRFYDAADVQAACIALQDRQGADVNVLLCLLWRSSMGERLLTGDLTRLDETVRDWREAVVRPLRTFRCELKNKALHPDPEAQEGFRNRVKAIELESERLELAMLEAAGRRPPREAGDVAEAARHNLGLYEVRLGTVFESDARQTLVQRLQAMSLG